MSNFKIQASQAGVRTDDPPVEKPQIKPLGRHDFFYNFAFYKSAPFRKILCWKETGKKIHEVYTYVLKRFIQDLHNNIGNNQHSFQQLKRIAINNELCMIDRDITVILMNNRNKRVIVLKPVYSFGAAWPGLQHDGCAAGLCEYSAAGDSCTVIARNVNISVILC